MRIIPYCVILLKLGALSLVVDFCHNLLIASLFILKLQFSTLAVFCIREAQTKHLYVGADSENSKEGIG